MRLLIAHPGIEIVDLAELQPVTGETQFLQHRFQHVQCAGIGRRHRSAADQCLGQVEGFHDQSRSNSLIDVLARVFSSTRLTMTAQ